MTRFGLYIDVCSRQNLGGADKNWVVLVHVFVSWFPIFFLLSTILLFYLKTSAKAVYMRMVEAKLYACCCSVVWSWDPQHTCVILSKRRILLAIAEGIISSIKCYNKATRDESNGFKTGWILSSYLDIDVNTRTLTQQNESSLNCN